MSKRKVAFVGLGIMGGSMAGHLQLAGNEVTVVNRTRTKSETWVAEYHGSLADTPREAANDADAVCLCVGNDNDVRGVVYGPDGALAGMAPGSVLIDHTTASAGLARELAETATEQGVLFVDAPVSGGQLGAENATLTIMVGGTDDAFAKADPVISAYARAVTHMGPAGSGQLTKMVNQICVAGLLQGLSEALAFGARAGLDLERVVEVISKGAGQSWQMDNRAQTMIDDHFDFGFAVDWMRKDLSICLAEARRNGARLPATALIDQFYAQIQEQGGGRWDTSSLIRLLRGG